MACHTPPQTQVWTGARGAPAPPCGGGQAARDREEQSRWCQAEATNQLSGAYSVDDELLICRCEEVTLGEIKAAIAAGATTLQEVRVRTRAGMGLCQGRTCGRLVSQLLARYTGRPRAAMQPRRTRAPVRPLLSELFTTSPNEEDS